MVNKPLWDFMDEMEGREKGSSYKNLQKEMAHQGYKKKKRKKK